ncbi:unnamed protein product [Effrenium voratum]|uniref:Uncharacterized protein n=1 Tax=Effrenium voratum TaxID=2562239 RepID=A0AA36MJJ9_9DINO|nr:unnamed protein product [Effrenium voratum]
MGLACGKSHLPQLPESKTATPGPAGDDDWRALLTAPSGPSAASPQRRQEPVPERARQEKEQTPRVEQAEARQEQDPEEPYGLLDEYVDDLLGIPAKDRPSWQRPSWKETQGDLSAKVPQMVREDGSRGPALATPEKLPSSSYMAGVLSGWAAIDSDKVTTDAKDAKEGPAPKRRVERPRD